MLEMIYCDKFIDKSIHFHSGLNVVLGDDVASNSIGKSTLLMIIDFVFGGRDYIKKNLDAIEQLGAHTFNFIFVFSEKRYYFSRSTDTFTTVFECNESFIKQKQMKLEEFNRFLQEKYLCEIEDLGFRAIVGRYFRVYGKENLNEHKPIQYFEKERASSSILALVKLFNKYSILKVYEEEITRLSEEKRLLKDAAKRNLIPNVTKAVFSKNAHHIKDLSSQLNVIKSDIMSASTDIEALVSKEILQLKRKKSMLVTNLNILNARLSRIKTNLQNKNIDLNYELEQFSVYFPDFNIDQAKKVDEFHSNLTIILHDELRSAEKELNMQIVKINEKIQDIDNNIQDKLNIKNAPKFAIDKVVELVAQIKQLTDENGLYTKSQKINKDLKSANVELQDLKEKVLDEISNEINSKMYELNKLIYTDQRRAPTINIHGDKYVFSTYGDTGTGTAFANMITFDLALLELTPLPAIAHDLPLLKNIENLALEKIILLYAASQKQIFIAIDKINSYDKSAAKILKEHEIIHLSKDKTLFIKNWKNALE